MKFKNFKNCLFCNHVDIRINRKDNTSQMLSAMNVQGLQRNKLFFDNYKILAVDSRYSTFLYIELQEV